MLGVFGNYTYDQLSGFGAAREGACGLAAEMKLNIGVLETKKSLAWVPEPRPPDLTRTLVLGRLADLKGGRFRLDRTRFFAHASQLKSLDKRVQEEVVQVYSKLDQLEGTETVYLAAIQDDRNTMRTFELLASLYEEYRKAKFAAEMLSSTLEPKCGRR